MLVAVFWNINRPNVLPKLARLYEGYYLRTSMATLTSKHLLEFLPLFCTWCFMSSFFSLFNNPIHVYSLSIDERRLRFRESHLPKLILNLSLGESKAAPTGMLARCVTCPALPLNLRAHGATPADLSTHPALHLHMGKNYGKRGSGAVREAYSHTASLRSTSTFE